MKIAVIGAGAMGSIYAARFAQAGHSVVAIDTWADHVDAINTHGLRVDGPAGKITAQGIVASRDMTRATDCNLYIIATKGSGVGPAAQAIAQVNPNAQILTIQNGLGAAERLGNHFPACQIMLGVAEGFGASMVGPGHAQHTAMKLIRLGRVGGGVDAHMDQVARTWQSAGFDVECFDDIDRLIWEKLLCNVTLSAPCCVFGCTVAQLLEDTDKWHIALGCMAEAFAVGQAMGIRFSFDDPVAYVTAFAKRVGGAKPSMLQDHENSRKSELDQINGAIAPLAEKAGLTAPYNATLSAVIRAREAAF